MQKSISLILALAAAGLGVAYFQEHQRVASLEAELAQLREQVATTAATHQLESADLLERTEILKRESEELRKRLADRPATAAAGGESKTERKEGAPDFFKGMAKMFKDPEMKKVMKTQQGMAMRMLYGDLTKELGLTPDEVNLVFDLLTERQMAVAGGAMDQEGKPGAAKEVQKAKETYDAELKNVLGDERMKKLETYERTMTERMALTQYQQSMQASGTPLEEKQRAQLLAIMSEERLKQTPGPLDPGTKDVVGAIDAMKNPAAIEANLRQQKELNQRILSRARTVLNADQTLAFEKAQQQMLEMQEMGVKMWRQMSSGKGER